MVLVMGMVGLIASVLLVGTYQLTAPFIARNRAEALERAIFEVIPGARSRATFLVRSDGSLELTDDPPAGSDLVYAGYDSTGALAGVAIEGSGPGFQEVLGIIFGYSPDCECVVGMKVLETKETPGLGDKIEKDPAFLANLSSLDVSLNDDQSELANPIEVVKKGNRTEMWQIEAISGATISSTAVARIIDAHAATFIPIVERNRGILETRGSNGSSGGSH
jgi:electron transport complex protein RnfG